MPDREHAAMLRVQHAAPYQPAHIVVGEPKIEQLQQRNNAVRAPRRPRQRRTTPTRGAFLVTTTGFPPRVLRIGRVLRHTDHIDTSNLAVCSDFVPTLNA